MDKETPIPPFMRPSEVRANRAPLPPAERHAALEQMEQDIAEHTRAIARTNTAPYMPLQDIKESIKRLTHREMRTLVMEIFKCRAKEDAIDGISQQELPDVLDRWAYGD